MTTKHFRIHAATSRWVCGALWLLAAVAYGAPQHPLDALQPEEFQAVRSILVEAGHVDEATRFAMIRLDEPAKAAVQSFQSGQPLPRAAIVIFLRGAELFRARVDLKAQRVETLQQVKDQQAGILTSEWIAAQTIVKADKGWRAAMRKRGYRRIDPDRFHCLPLAAGYFAEPEFEGKRVMRVQCMDLEGTTNHLFQRPIEGLTAVIDLQAGKVLKLVDEGVVPVPSPTGNYDEASLKPYRPAMKPITVSQPQGASFSWDGSFVEWGPWRFHLRLDRRRGAIVSLASFDDRSVLYQASLSEMWVPYMDPAYGWFFKNYFDAGEYGFGLFGTPLKPGVDCPDYALFIDGAIATEDASAVPYPSVLCVFEQPTLAPAWRHYESSVEDFNGRAGRVLVARMVAAIGNYDYVMDYVFMPTGAIKVSIASTGIDITKGVAARTMADPTAAADTAYGNLIAPGLVGVFHDHFFSLRFDLDVDGTANRFVRDRLVQETLPEDHPRRSLWTVASQRVRTEAAAKLDIDLRRPELWRVESLDRMNAMGNPTSYALEVGGNALPQLTDDDYPLRRAGFARHHLWVTPYAPDELFSAGDYPNQSRGGDGLPAWTARNRSLDGTDLVLWYTLGFHHVTAAEDWPVLPSHPKSVVLRPFNFFDRSQVINLPPAAPAASAQ